MASLNRLCSVCGREPSSMYCSCTKTAVYLCDGCFIPHKNKAPRLVHTTVPVEVTDISHYQQRCETFAEGREELLQNLTRIDQCCAEVAAAVDTLISRAQQYRDDFIGKMQQWKQEVSRNIYESIAEAEASLDKEDAQLNATFSFPLRNFRPGSLSFFKFEKGADTTDAFLQSLVKIEYSQTNSATRAGEHIIFWVEEANLKWFDVLTEQMSPLVSLQSAIECNVNSRWATWDAARVILCGGGTAGAVQQLPDMTFGHRAMGIIVWKGAVHVFGSHDGEGKQRCERLDLASCNRWDSLPDMLQVRILFTPAIWRDAVYLCGGYNTTVEVFDGRAMRLLDLQLPESSTALACVRGDSLLVLTNNHLTVISHSAVAVSKNNPAPHRFIPKWYAGKKLCSRSFVGTLEGIPRKTATNYRTAKRRSFKSQSFVIDLVNYRELHP